MKILQTLGFGWTVVVGIVLAIVLFVFLRIVIRRLMINERVECLFYQYFGRSYECGCGHVAKRKTLVVHEGESNVFVLPQSHEFCPDCWPKQAIKCAWCGEPIYLGDPVTLYSPNNSNFVVPAHAMVYQQKPLQLVGCMGWDCALSGMDRAGFYVAPGKIQRVQTGMEQMLLRIAGGNNEPLVISDISDPRQAVSIDEEGKK